MEEEYDYIKKELFLDDPLAQKAAQKLIDDWKKQLSGDKQLLADEVHDKYAKNFIVIVIIRLWLSELDGHWSHTTFVSTKKL